VASWVVEVDGPIRHIAIPVPTLRVRRARNDAIRLEEAVDKRRKRPSALGEIRSSGTKR